MKTYFKISILSVIALIITSCTLDVQDEFNFRPDINDNDPFENLTAWQFILARQTNTIADPETGARRLDDDNLDYFRAAVEATGLQSLYANANTTSTFLFLSNRSFINGNHDRNVNVITNGRRGVAPRTVNVDEFFNDLSDEQLNRLRAVLLYHIVPGEFLDQLQAFPSINTPREFPTLLPQVTTDLVTEEAVAISNESSLIGIERRQEFLLFINPDTAALIPSASSDNFDQGVALHNFVLSNGIGHFIEEAVRFQDYDLYSNFDLSL